jgi:hypothetical protein
VIIRSRMIEQSRGTCCGKSGFGKSDDTKRIEFSPLESETIETIKREGWYAHLWFPIVQRDLEPGIQGGRRRNTFALLRRQQRRTKQGDFTVMLTKTCLPQTLQLPTRLLLAIIVWLWCKSRWRGSVGTRLMSSRARVPRHITLAARACHL